MELGDRRGRTTRRVIANSSLATLFDGAFIGLVCRSHPRLVVHGNRDTLTACQSSLQSSEHRCACTGKTLHVALCDRYSVSNLGHGGRDAVGVDANDNFRSRFASESIYEGVICFFKIYWIWM
jgi:hypothetical protein